jgi:hypothetical protein
MRNPSSTLLITDPDPTRSKGQRATTEVDFFACCHCGAHKQVPPGCDPASLGGWCRMCSTPHRPAYHCERPGCFTCVPFEKRLELDERRDRFRRDISSYG